MSIARTMMLHSAIHWPEVADPSLWPMAVQYATDLYNKVPDPSTGLCPDDLFTKTQWEQQKFMTFAFGDVHSMFWTRQFLMARNFHIGNQEILEESSWISAQIMQVLFLLVLNLDSGAITP